MTPITQVWPGRSQPRGAHWDGEGVNFALFSEHAERVELCIFDATGRRELQRVPLLARTDQVFHCYLPEARPGMLYGYRVHGPYRPEEGLRFNPHKLLLDPYARNIVGTVRWSDALYGYSAGHKRNDLSFDRRDSASAMPKAKIIDPAFTWGNDRPPDVPWHDMVIYELNVRGFTMRHPEVPPSLRGTYAGLATAPVIDYLRRLGVTAVELMPVHYFVDERRLTQLGLRNFWGYNTIGYFAPEARYSASGKVNEFKTMVKTLHSAGLEIILDVVYNHTAEGNELGPTLCFRGLDNSSYYRLGADDPRLYMDYTGCGNTLNMRHPHVLQVIMDSLRYWVTEMHVDGFRFDLASALARELHEVDRLGAFFDVLRQDPVLDRVKLIAEPWDLGEGGYQVGNFPPGWAEWNDKYRDAMRAFWRGDGGLIGEFARRITGSSDLYGSSGRAPHASINFVTAHDGFTLRDLVSYNTKHNLANGEDNRDGNDNNLSWNCGVEGETERCRRARAARAAVTQLPGDTPVVARRADAHCGRRDRANAAGQQQRLLPGQRVVVGRLDDRRGRGKLSRLHAPPARVASRPPHLPPAPLLRGALSPRRRCQGHRVAQARWHRDDRCRVESRLCPLPRRLSSPATRLDEIDARARPVIDDDFLLLFNAHDGPIEFTLPGLDHDSWTLLLDTARDDGLAPDGKFEPAKRLSAGRPLACAAAAVPTHRMKRAHRMPFGAQLEAGQPTAFRLWAPAASDVELVLDPAHDADALPMDRDDGGWYRALRRRRGRRHALRIPHRRRT